MSVRSVAGALQSVHQLGRGIAAFSNAVEFDAVDFYSVEKDTSSGRSRPAALIEAYARKAVHLACAWRGRGRGRGQQVRTEGRQERDVSAEWEAFLRRVS